MLLSNERCKIQFILPPVRRDLVLSQKRSAKYCLQQTKEIVMLSRQSLTTLLKDIGFKFRKESNRRIDAKRISLKAIDEIIKACSHDVSSLQPYHCDFNAIELVWASAKGYYNKHIDRVGYRDENALSMLSKALEYCSQNNWENCVRHTNDLIKNYYEPERHLADIAINPIINSGESSISGKKLNSD
ncbi:hypothetical protein Trydic_g7246 [Trypoxylus dichotomus]